MRCSRGARGACASRRQAMICRTNRPPLHWPLCVPRLLCLFRGRGAQVTRGDTPARNPDWHLRRRRPRCSHVAAAAVSLSALLLPPPPPISRPVQTIVTFSSSESFGNGAAPPPSPKSHFLLPAAFPSLLSSPPLAAVLRPRPSPMCGAQPACLLRISSPVYPQPPPRINLEW